MIDVIVVAAGSGTRFGEKKQWKLLKGKPLVAYCLEVFEAHPLVASIVMGVPSEDVSFGEEILSEFAPSKGKCVYPGGMERYETVHKGLCFVESSLVAVHDGARPFVSPNLVDRLYHNLGSFHGVIPVIKPKDTVKEVESGVVSRTLDRKRTVLVQTPQLFRRDALVESYSSILDFSGITDDAAVLERSGYRIAIVEGDELNFKVTTLKDWERAVQLLSNYRVGFGYDIHRTGEGSGIKLGGVEIPADLSLIGHSDADVLIHALVDALLGAVGGGDIGEIFPDTDERFRGANSVIFLKEAVERVKGKGFEVCSVDITVVAQKPKLASYKGLIRERLASVMGIPSERVNVKAKTKEGVDATGRGEAVEAYAVVVVR